MTETDQNTMSWPEFLHRLSVEHPHLVGLARQVQGGGNNNRDGMLCTAQTDALRRRREIELGQEFAMVLEFRARDEWLADKQGPFAWWKTWCERKR